MGFIALGTGSTAAAATQSALVTEIDRNAATYARKDVFGFVHPTPADGSHKAKPFPIPVVAA